MVTNRWNLIKGLYHHNLSIGIWNALRISLWSIYFTCWLSPKWIFFYGKILLIVIFQHIVEFIILNYTP